MIQAPCAAPPPQPTTPLISASQVTLYRECARKWAWKYIAHADTPQNTAAVLGDEVDTRQLQPYLRDGRSFDYTRESGYIAASGLAWLPAPITAAPDSGLEVQKHFVIPSATARTPAGAAAFGYQGYLDLWLPRGGLPDIPDAWDIRTRAPIPIVGDFKTTSDISRWAKTVDGLRTDVQAQLYASWAMYETGSRIVDLAWIYFQTRGAKKTRRVHLRLVAEDVMPQLLSIDRTAIEMAEARRATTDPLSLPPNVEMCEAYGGCPYRDRCNLSPSQIVDSIAAKAATAKGNASMNTASLFANLQKKIAGEAVPPPSPPPPAEDQVPEALKHPYVPKSAAGAAMLGLPPPPAPLGINPPEASLPPAPPVGAAATPPPAGEVPAKRHRRTKAEMEAARAAEEQTTDGGVGFPPLQPGERATYSDGTILEAPIMVTATWGEERYSPVQFQAVSVGPFSATGPVQPGESIAEAIIRLEGSLATAAVAARTTQLEAFAKALGSTK